MPILKYISPKLLVPSVLSAPLHGLCFWLQPSPPLSAPHVFPLTEAKETASLFMGEISNVYSDQDTCGALSSGRSGMAGERAGVYEEYGKKDPPRHHPSERTIKAVRTI